MRKFGVTRLLLVAGLVAVAALVSFGLGSARGTNFTLQLAKGCDGSPYVGDPYECHSYLTNQDDLGNSYIVHALVDRVNSSSGVIAENLFALGVPLVFVNDLNVTPVSCTNGSGSGTTADPFIPTASTTCTLPGDLTGQARGGRIDVGNTPGFGTQRDYSVYTLQPGDYTANPQHSLSDQIDYTVTNKCDVNNDNCDPTLVNVVQASASATVQKRGASASTTILNASGSPVLTVPVGSTVHDSGKVVENTNPAPIVPGPVPTGSVSITFFQGGDCDGTVLDTGTATLDGTGAFNATGMPETLTAAGQYSFQATYNGDGFYNASPTSACEPLTVVPASPSIATNLSSSAGTAGVTVHDSATLSGATSNAGGTVTYTVYSDSECSTKFADGGKVNVTNGSVPNSNGVTFSIPGTYYWQASYSGDANNDPALSRCTDEQLVVSPASPSITTLLSQSAVEPGTGVNDSAVLTGATADAGGTVTYTVFSDSSCSTKFADGGTVTVTNGSVPNSNGVTFNTPATYYWQASYSGDAKNKPAVSACTDEPLQVAPLVGTFCVKINKLTPKQLFVGRKTTVTIHLTKNNKPVKGIRVLIKGPKVNVRTKASNGKGVIKDSLKMKKKGILIFTPIATPHCNAKRLGVTNVFTPPVTG
jgi:hypothetical protein